MRDQHDLRLVPVTARLATAFALALAATPLLAQAQPRKSDSLLGEVTVVDADSGRLTVKPDTGGAVLVALKEGANLLRTKPGATNLEGALPLAIGEIVAGDRVLVRGTLSEDKATFAARQVVVMSRADIAQKQQAERADWQKRGILGVVKAVDPAAGQITIEVRRFGAARPVVIPTADRRVVFRRYAADSVKFDDARPSALAEVQVGDQLRALGGASPDGGPFLAEQIVFGSFRIVAGTLTVVNAEKGEVALKDEEGGKSLTVAVGPDARVRKLPPEMALRMSARFREGAGANAAPGAGAAPAAATTEAPGGGAAAGRGGPGGPGGGSGPGGGGFGGRGPGGPSAEDLLERLPAVTLLDLKAGQRVMVSSTRGSDPSRLNAIVLVTGLEALLAPSPPAAGRGGRGGGGDLGLPPDLMDLGMGAP